MTPSEIAAALDAQHKYDKAHYPPANPLFAQAAATIRAQAEQLKIATEALEKVKMTAKVGGSHSTEGYAHDECIDLATQALDRIKEVG